MTAWFETQRASGKILAQLVSHVATRAILLGSTVLIAWTVGAAGYGLFAVGLVMYQAGVLLRDAGLGQASVILGGQDTGTTYRTFVAGASVGISFALLIAALSGPFTSLIGLPGAAPLVQVLALAFGIGSLGIASIAALERDLRFTARAIVEVSSYIALGGVTLAGIALGWGAMALAVGYVAQGLVQAALAIALVPPWRDRGGGIRFGSLARYGGLLWAAALLTYLATNVDNVAVAALGGAAAIGAYALSYTVGTMIAISLAQVLNRVALPYYARATDDAARLATFAAVVPLSTALAIVAAAPVIALAPEVSRSLIESTATGAPLAILATYGTVRALGVALGTALNGIGAARPVTIVAAVNVVLLAILVVPGYWVAGPTGVALVVLASLVISIVLLEGSLRQHGASLAFLAVPATGVGLLLLLVVGPFAPVPLVVRVVAGAGAMLLAGWWAYRIVRSDRAGSVVVGGT